MTTLFQDIYDIFFDKITDDMYVELTEYDTKKDCQSILINAIPLFEFPKKSLTYVKYEIDSASFQDNSYFTSELDVEEKNILATLMMQGWLQRQITSIENTRLKYYGNTFKLTSQANHLQKLIALKDDVRRDAQHLQRLYKRRKVDSDGTIKSAWSIFNTYGSSN